MKENIYVNIYGCSWSYGVLPIDSGKSWPYYLSLMLPKNIIVRNFSLFGSSLEYSIYQLKQNKDNSQINIFQITSYFRFTIWDNNYFILNNMDEKTNNYYDFDKKEVDKHFTSLNLGDSGKKNKRWFDNYIDNGFHKGKTIEASRSSHLFYALNNSSYCFGFLPDSLLKEYNIDCISEIVDINLYSKDDGYHFGKEGNKLLAKLVYDKIKNRMEKLSEL